MNSVLHGTGRKQCGVLYATRPFEFIWSAMPRHRFPLQSTLNLWERFLSGQPWFVRESGENSPHSKFDKSTGEDAPRTVSERLLTFEFIWSAMPRHRFPLQSTMNLWERFLSGSPWFASESGENSPHSKLGVRFQEFYCLRFSPRFKMECPSPGYRK